MSSQPRQFCSWSTSMSSAMKFINSLSLLCFLLLINSTLSDSTNDGGADTSYDVDDSPELEVPRSPKINGPPHEHIRVPVGSQIHNLTCEYYGIPTPKVVWAKDVSEVPAHFKVENFPESGKSVLVFPTTTAHNTTELAGNYTCAAANFVSRTQKVYEVSFGPPEEDFVTTTVTYDQEETTDVGAEEEETVEDVTTTDLDTTTQLPSKLNIVRKT